MAEHVLDNGPAPPLLVQAWDFERYGTDVMKLSPGALRAMRTASNAYGALSGYKTAAPNTNAWINRNPKAWEFVSGVIAMRLEMRQREQEEE